MPSSRYYRFKTLDKEGEIKKIKVFIFWLFILIIFSGLAWIIFLSPLFKIRYINTSDNNYLNGNDIKNIISKAPFKLGENLLFLSKDQLKNNLAGAFPDITDIVIRKNLFHTLIIDFRKRVQLGIWCNLNCYYFDKEGTAFAETPQTEGSLILKIEDESKNNVSLGDRVLSDEQITFITAVNNKINDDGKLKILKFKINSSFSTDLEAVTDKNWSIYFNGKQDPAAAVSNLFTVLKEAVKNTNNLEYIDLRIPGRVFYKLK